MEQKIVITVNRETRKFEIHATNFRDLEELCACLISALGRTTAQRGLSIDDILPGLMTSIAINSHKETSRDIVFDE